MDHVGGARATEAMYRPLVSSGPDDAVSIILKLRGETCDVDCLYCYEKRKEAPGGARITVTDVERLGEMFARRPVAVELHGGEPLTAGRAHVAAILDQLAAQSNVVRVSLQTNGVRLDDQWLDLFDEHYPALEIGISLDGDAYGNSWRVGYDGNPIYEKVAAALELLARRGRQAGIITVVTPAVSQRPVEVLDHLAGFAAVRAINFAPCFDATVTRPTNTAGLQIGPSRLRQAGVVDPVAGPAWAVTPAEYCDFVLGVAGHWISSGLFRRLTVEPVVSTIRRLRGQDTASCHFSDRKCDHVLTLYPGGRFGSCDELPWPEAELGVTEGCRREADVHAAQGASRLLLDARALMVKCLGCDYRSVCGGGCVATRWRAVRAVGNDEAYCNYRTRLVDGIAALLAAPQHPGGAFCRRVHWRLRRPNTMADVAAFLSRWESAPARRPTARLHSSPYGNINAAGLPGIHEADDLDPGHPQWRAGIEGAVWPLVDVLTRRWGCVTYDSCEGHRYDGLELAPRGLHVGVLPRDRHEAARLAARLCRAVTDAADRLPPACRAGVARHELICEATGRIWPVLDLHLDPALGAEADGGWTAYFAGRGRAVAVLVEALDAAAADTDRPACACLGG